ncbi:cytochrome P450 [Salinibacterium hongtaonis]|uniref:Cytochrome P450 n=1 Tax=Homoserinimonas hongtaonis TaxID=2079791 RepID=A0A2U1T2F8_9MICO|nr:cytochrome P450 [Salinibacterium hongtaonis]PWB98038.1 hypothetical protein DF220_09500 [Salinibacterium hongtaonis]
MSLPAPLIREVTAAELESWPPTQETRKQPASYFEKLRGIAGVYSFPQPHPNGRPMFFASSWDAVSHILRDDTQFDSDLTDVLPELAGLIVPPYPEVSSHYRIEGIAFTEGEDHDVKRSWAEMLFEKDRLDAYAPVIAEVADSLIDRFISEGRANITEDFAEALPLEVLTIIMGLPREDASTIKGWTDAITKVGMGTPSPEEAAAAGLALEQSSDYAYRQCLARLENPVGDYLSDVVKAQVDRDGEFDKNAMVVHVRSMILSTYHTTSAMLASAAVHLCRLPELQQELRENPSKFRKFVEESVRLEGPLQWHPRRAVTTTVVEGVEIPEGSIVFASFRAACHDPAKFEDPYEFNPNRRNMAHHLSFGAGTHRCPGAPLARLYAQVGFERLLSRLTNIELDEENSILEPGPGFNFRIPTRVAVTFTAA